MTFFYDLNKRLAEVASKQDSKQLSESAVAERATGDYSAKKARAGKDIGKPGKTFAKIAKSAGERYGSKERGEKVAGAVLAKLRAKESVEESDMDESALQAYLGKKKYGETGMKALQKAGREGASKDKMEKIRARHDKMDEADVEEGNKFAHNVLKAKAAGLKKADLDGDGDMETVRETNAPVSPVKKVDVPAFQRKAQGGNWKVSQKDLEADRLRNISDPKGLARMRGENPADIDEGWDDMLKYVKDKDSDMKVGSTRKTHKGTVTKTATGLRHTRDYDPDTGETKTDDDKAEKRGRGRPKKYTADNPRQERVTAKSRKADRTAYTKKKKVDEYGDFGPMEDQDQLVDRGEYDREGDMAKEQLHTIEMAATELSNILSDEENLPEWVQSKITKAMDYIDTARDYMKSSKADGEEPIAEKAVSVAQQQAAGIALAAKRKGKKPAGKGAAAAMAKMPEKELEKFAKTKHKGLPEKKDKKKEEEVEENTVAGNVAPAAEAPKSKGKGGIQFGKGIYDSMNRELEGMIAESMNISMNMSDSENGPSHSVTVTATDEDAVKLAALLKMAGVGASQDAQETCPECGKSPCGCEELDENQPDWPTDQEIVGDDDPHLERFAGGLNGPKSTGQTTGAPFNRQDSRQGALEEEADELSRIKEMAGIREAKPDYIDLDKDGNKKEAMKKAADDKEKAEKDKKVEESIFALTNLWKEYKDQ